ncbi:MAG: hypothetical protein ACI9FO_000180 [Methylophagaceae bacterium]|jgi:hypothetical protein
MYVTLASRKWKRCLIGPPNLDYSVSVIVDLIGFHHRGIARPAVVISWTK